MKAVSKRSVATFPLLAPRAMYFTFVLAIPFRKK
jgi:hypothetical protein